MLCKLCIIIIQKMILIYGNLWNLTPGIIENALSEC